MDRRRRRIRIRIRTTPGGPATVGKKRARSRAGCRRWRGTFPCAPTCRWSRADCRRVRTVRIGRCCSDLTPLGTRVSFLSRNISDLGFFSFSYFICPDTPFLAFSPYKRPPPTDILLQLKRTVEVVSVLNDATDSGGGGRGRIKTLLDGALHAGKAARNERVVPEIRRLREFGSDGTPPSALARVVAEVRDWTRILT